MVLGGQAKFQELEVWGVTQTTKYYSLGGQRIALQRDGGMVNYIHTDQLGSTRRLTDGAGAAASESVLRYMPYGQPRPATYDEVERHDRFAQGYTEATYTGQYRDSNTDLMYYGARFYDPFLGRFISPDSIVPDPGNPQALNRYSYTLNNPLNRVDPSGHFPITPLPFPDQWLPQVGQWVAEGWARLQPWLYQLAIDLGQMAELGPAVANGVAPTIQSASDAGARLGQTGSPNGLGPDGKWRFKSDKFMTRHFNKHVLERDEGWHELLQMSPEELNARVQDPQSLSALQDAYQQIGQRVSTSGNYIGSEVGAQRVFFDVETRVATILQGGSDEFISIMRVVSRQEFLQSLVDNGLQLAPGVNLEALLIAAGL